MNWIGHIASEGLLQYLVDSKDDIMAPFATSGGGNVVDDIYIASVWHPLLIPTPKTGDKLYLAAYGGGGIVYGDYPQASIRIWLVKRTLLSSDSGIAAAQAEGPAVYRAGEVICRKLAKMHRNTGRIDFVKPDNTNVSFIPANIIKSVDRLELVYYPDITDEKNEINSVAALITGEITINNRGLI
jgi:hypothetical protein